MGVMSDYSETLILGHLPSASHGVRGKGWRMRRMHEYKYPIASMFLIILYLP